MTPDAGAPPEAVGTPRPATRRGRSVVWWIAGAAVLALAAGAVWWRFNSGWVKTDNAQTAGDLMTISSQAAGIVTSIPVHQDEYVKRGAVLVRLDPTPYRVALAQARMQYRQAEAQVAAAQAALAAQEELTSTNISAARAQLAAARPTVPQAQATFSQQRETVSKDIVAAQTTVRSAAAAQVQTARSTLAQAEALLATYLAQRQQVIVAQPAR